MFCDDAQISGSAAMSDSKAFVPAIPSFLWKPECSWHMFRLDVCLRLFIKDVANANQKG